MPTLPTLARGKTNLTDQFFYRVGIAEGNSVGVFMAMFRESFALVGFMSTDATIFPDTPGPMTTFPVFQW
jgi:hypothetical protein